MPRNACKQCRSRKIKCVAVNIGGRCERCAARSIPCSLISSGGEKVIRLQPRCSIGASSMSPGAFSGRRASEGRDLSMDPAACYDTHGGHESQIGIRGYDIGHGTPAEILRENELSQELLVLYFDHFSDIHWMFDRETFLAEFPQGGASKMVLYAMMALAIRYSNLPVFEQVERLHRGESLFRESRKLLREEFDFPSLPTIQAYVLLSTYHLTFGGARKAWLYLGTASNFAKVLRLHERPIGTDPFKREMSQRLLCTIAAMDRTLSPSLDVPCHFTTTTLIKDPCSDEDLRAIKTGVPSSVHTPVENLIAEILALSLFFSQVCLHHRKGSESEVFQSLECQILTWRRTLPASLVYNSINFSMHQAKKTLRQFLHMHLLYHHISQLIYFPSLQGIRSWPLDGQRIVDCHHHASEIVNIIEYAEKTARVEVHNVCIGQFLTVAAAVLTHACLTAPTRDQGRAIQSNIASISDCLSRIKQHCRMFRFVAVQLDTFFQICSRNSTAQSVFFGRNKRLIKEILHYGSAFERLGEGDAGRITSLEEHPDTPPNDICGSSQAGVGAAIDFLDWLPDSTSEMEATYENCAWMFNESSLNDLYSIPFMEAVASMDLDMAFGSTSNPLV